MSPDQHQTKSLSDKIRLIGELEHARYHALRSASVSLLKSENATDQETKEAHESDAFVYVVWAEKSKQLRRQLMQKFFPNIPEEMWCLCKTTASLKQVAYEVCDGDISLLRDIDFLADDIWSNALQADVTDCGDCAEDKGPVDNQEQA